MMIARDFSGFRTFVVMALAFAGVAAWGQTLHDPANLAGEQVRASVVADPLPVNRRDDGAGSRA